MSDAELTQSAAPLGYASPAEARPQVGLYRVALSCALAPLAVGLGTLALYALTFWRSLPDFGFLTCLVGGVLCVVGLICMAGFRARLRSCDPELRAAWIPRARRAELLLVANVPIAFLSFIAGVYLMDQFPVTLINGTDAAVTDITITAPGETFTLARLDPGESRRVLVTIGNDGSVAFAASHKVSRVSGVAADYVTSGLGNGKATVRFTDAGPVVRKSR